MLIYMNRSPRTWFGLPYSAAGRRSGGRRAGRRIAGQLSPLSPPAARALLCAAARSACRRLALSHPGACEYLAEAAAALYPRIAADPSAVLGVFSVIG
jgi:hypothetical protein